MIELDFRSKTKSPTLQPWMYEWFLTERSQYDDLLTGVVVEIMNSTLSCKFLAWGLNLFIFFILTTCVLNSTFVEFCDCTMILTLVIKQLEM